MDFKFKDAHHCDAAVIMCVDFRFTQYYIDGVKETFGIETFDTWAVPGAGKNFVAGADDSFAAALIEKIKTVSVGLHDIKKIIVLDHADCGAYGGRKAFQNIETETNKHAEDLAEAKKVLHAEFPELEILTGIAALSEDQSQVTIEKL